MKPADGRGLIIDDDPDIRTRLARLLAADYDVTLADDGLDALARFESGYRFDVVLSDLAMPRMTGTTLLHNLRRIDAAQADRVVLLTANPTLAMAAGSYYFLTKPFPVRELKRIVRQVVAAARSGYFPEHATSAAGYPAQSVAAMMSTEQQ
jgi:CheY-like chemotaxis protein